jgi:hypothetical protein
VRCSHSVAAISRPAQLVTAGVQFGVGQNGEVSTFQAKKSKLQVLKFQTAIAVTAIAMTDQIPTDLRNYRAHILQRIFCKFLEALFEFASAAPLAPNGRTVASAM